MPAHPHNLAEVATGGDYVVVDVTGSPDWAERLAEIGFIPGEHVRVLTRGVPGGDPLAVRIGLSTFALRRAEAACVRVRPVASDKVMA